MIVVTNMGVTLFIFMVGALPSLNDHLSATGAGVEFDFLDGVGRRAATLVITLSLPYFVAARRRDFI